MRVNAEKTEISEQPDLNVLFHLKQEEEKGREEEKTGGDGRREGTGGDGRREDTGREGRREDTGGDRRREEK